MSTASGPSAGVAARQVAVEVVVAVMDRGRSLKAALSAAQTRLSDPRDRALVEAICLAVLRRHPAYQAALGGWLQRPLGRRDADLKALLLVGLAQLEALALPPHAALSATVETCRALGRPRQAGMVNAILRRAQREGVPASVPEDSWPDWLRRQVRSDWAEMAESVFVGSAQPAPMWLRVNRQQVSARQYQDELADIGLQAQALAGLDDALRLDTAVAVTLLPGFAEGRVSIQDVAAQQVADALAPAPGAQVLDACAAPGGKAAHLLERDPSLRLTLLEIEPRRVQRLRETLQRTCPQARPNVHTADAANLPAWWDGQHFDAVLLDAPCSATGIVRRQPDVLLHRRHEDIIALLALQRRLLDALWTTLRPGGRLLYATCSILACENREQISAFLGRHDDAEAEPLAAAFGRPSGPGRQRLPGDDDGDGFFYASLIKRG